MMTYYTIPPPANLAHYVRCFWVLENDEPYIYRSLADGCAEMVFHYNGVFDEITGDNKTEASFRCGLHGQSRRVRRFIIDKAFGIFGVYLYPFAVKQLFNIAAHALSDEMPDIIALLGQEGVVLEEKIMLAKNNRERANIMASFFERRLYRVRDNGAAVVHIISKVISTKGLVDINTLAGDCYLSRRQFERNFKEHAGFSPKLYARIIRFQAATKEYGIKNKSLTEIAYDCGYYDQSHFIHDFKEFSGFHPKEYFHGTPEGTEYRNVKEVLAW